MSTWCFPTSTVLFKLISHWKLLGLLCLFLLKFFSVKTHLNLIVTILTFQNSPHSLSAFVISCILSSGVHFSVTKLCLALCNPMDWSTPGFLSFTISQSLLKLMFIELVMPYNHLIFCYPLLFLPSFLPSIRVFSNELALCIRWPKNWNFSISISPSEEYSGLISLRIDWFDILAVQGTLKSLFQHHNSKASILQCSAFFMVHLSHLYMTTGKIIAWLDRPVVSAHK